ncbi:uncharacterized protein LOC117784166 [Drosophila innubila]|uniref:uncharacterized protein LOC117784166 n=1 Tax=Drosophila innubila TaxID=198719 RepID=UPI00148D9EB0|nr:uncharacterized protein LOC117784166 [Drosophila innubila]
MWEQLEKYRNHFLQYEIKDVMKPSSINCLQNTEWRTLMNTRDFCKCFPQRCPPSSTYFEDRAQLAYGDFALPKLLKEMDSSVSLTHWRAIVSLSEFLLNPLNAQRAILELDIIRKVKNAFMRMRLEFHASHYNEVETYLKIFNILSRNMIGAERIANCKCLRIEFYKILKNKEYLKDDLAAEILFNLTSKPKVLGIVLADPENFESVADIFKQDPCRPFYPVYLWHHLCNMLEVAPEQGIELGFFELLHSRIVNRLPKFWDMNSKAFALLLRCGEGQRRFDNVDGIKMIYEVFSPQVQVDNYENVVLILLNGLHSKRSLWRSREFTVLPCHLGRRLSSETNPRLQLYCLKGLRELSVMPCIKRYIIANWLEEIRQLVCLDAEAECARDSLLNWLRRDIADSS